MSQGFQHDMCLKENDLTWSTLPKCLKTLTFKNFHGNDSEICFLKCILQNGLVSDKMNICWCDYFLRDQKWEKEVKKTLKSIACGSKSCVITCMYLFYLNFIYFNTFIRLFF